MMRLVQSYWPSSIALMLGAFIAIGLTPVILATAAWYQEWYTQNNPVATLEWHTVERMDPNTLRFTLLVTRHEDCESLRLSGYTGQALNKMLPVDSLGREDNTPPQTYPVGITVQSKPWIMRGIYGSTMALAMYYACGERIVKAPLLIGTVPEWTTQ